MKNIGFHILYKNHMVFAGENPVFNGLWGPGRDYSYKYGWRGPNAYSADTRSSGGGRSLGELKPEVVDQSPGLPSESRQGPASLPIEKKNPISSQVLPPGS